MNNKETRKTYVKSKIKRYKKTWLTLEGYTYLKDEKKRQNKSMTEILNNILKKYGKRN